MLTPARAQTILSFTLTALAVLTALMLLVFLWGVFTSGDRTQTVFSVNIPLDLTLSLPGGRYNVSTFHLPLGDLSGWARNGWLAGFTLLMACVIGLLWRARQFTRRLLRDPFHPDNARDLTLAAQLALIGQVVAALQPLLNGWMFARIQPLEALRRQLPEDAIVRGMNTDSSLPFTLFGVNLTPLLIAAVCVLFAAALTQAAHIREQERQLRAEQELTV